MLQMKKVLTKSGLLLTELQPNYFLSRARQTVSMELIIKHFHTPSLFLFNPKLYSLPWLGGGGGGGVGAYLVLGIKRRGLNRRVGWGLISNCKFFK